jgi:uncharacterized protein DUF6308
VPECAECRSSEDVPFGAVCIGDAKATAEQDALPVGARWCNVGRRGRRRHLGLVTLVPDRHTATTGSVPPVNLRNGIDVGDPLQVVLGYLETWRFELGDASATFAESDLRLANRGGARISAAEIAAILERRNAIERALRAAPVGASLAGATSSVPWLPLTYLFDAFADIRGVGFSKMTKALHPKRPGLIPMLDSVVQRYLTDDDPGVQSPFGERAVALVRGYKRDLDRNRDALRAVLRELARRGHDLSEVRILDLLIWWAQAA